MPNPTTPSGSRTRRRLLLAALLTLVILILAITPPLVNVSRYKRRIVTSMSESLGRPVHLDDIKLHLLPRPGFTLQNLVVSEDPAFGNEPIIRANVVTVQLRLSSLWRRQVEFSTIRFDIDEHGAGASLNLVRNPAGRWNIESLLSHAAQVDAAPTVQKTAGPTPRFPYIEANGARVNLKLGDEKMPFSLTDAEFALWLPSPNQWRLRLVAKPARTDTNAADVGTLRLEGTFNRAATFADTPADLAVSWHDAQLGEATRLLTGDDMGWRGTVHLDANLRGPLSHAALATSLTINDLRRADFVPPQLLDVTTNCTATAAVTSAMLHNSTCTVAGTDLTFASPAIDVQQPATAPFTLTTTALPLPYAFNWLRLFSPRIPATANPAGTLALNLNRTAPQTWSGAANLTLGDTTFPFAAGPNSGPDAASCPNALTLEPTAAHLTDTTAITLNGTVTYCGYTLHATGPATAADILAATANVPPLADGIAKSLPASTPRLDLTCTRTWTGDQTCLTQKPATPTKHPNHHHYR